MGSRPKSKNAKIRRMAENVIMVCLAIIVVLSGWKIWSIMHDYSKNEEVYKDIAKQAQTDGFTGDIDFDELRKTNPDVIGWIYYKDSPVDYPIVKGSDNDKYLHTMFDGTYGTFGTLFADAVTEAPFAQFNTIVYGHHMKDGSMFGSLRRLKDPEYAKEHPQMELITPEGKFHLEIWAFLNQPADSKIYTTNIHDKDERADYIRMVEDISEYTTGVSVSPEDRLVVLSTCAYEYQNARYMVVGKLTPWNGQKIDMSYDTDIPEEAEASGDSE